MSYHQTLNNIDMKKSLLLFCFALLINQGYAQSPTLVIDANTVHTTLGEVTEPITYNGYVYFIQDDGTNGSEVWRTDGSTTEMFTDIDNAFSGDPFSLTVWNGSLYFSTSISGVWKSDGTVLGTGAFTSAYGTIIPAATKLYLFDTPNRGLSITDGVSGADFIGTLGFPGPNILGNAGYNFTTLTDGLFYVINDPASTGTELVYVDGIMSNGLPVNPPVIIDIYPGTDGSFPGAFTVYNNKLHFMAVREQLPSGTLNNGNGPKTLFESDGTVAGTISLVDFGIFGGLASRTTEYIEMTVFDSKLMYFNITGATNTNDDTELFTYDGTSHTKIHTFTNTSFLSAFKKMQFKIEAGGLLYFTATDNKVDSNFQTDGLTVSSSSFDLISAIEYEVLPGLAVLSKHPNLSQNLFSMTLGGTETSLYNFFNSSDLSPSNFTVLGTDAYFVANQDADGSQLWKTDGTALGTTQVTINAINSTNGSDPNPIFELGGNLYFSATQTETPILYILDETNSITGPVSSIIPNENGVELNNEYYYNIGNNLTDQLWKMDGNALDGINFTNLFTVENNINDLTVSGSNIFYVSFTTAEGVELWVSDGTATHTVIDLAPGQLSTQPGDLIDVNGTLYFRGIDLNKGVMGLWKSDGTLAGTTLVFSDANGDISQLTKYNDNLFFVVDDLFNGIEPMVYSHSAEGFQVFDLNESGDSEPYGFQEMNGELYFFTKTPRALWKYDGTTAENAVLIDNLPFFGNNVFAENIFASSNRLFYTYDNTRYAYNGTTTNTFLAGMNQPITIDNMVYYKSVSTKWELWESDGTTEGTKYIVDISSSDKLFSFNDELYFAYDDGLLGKELYKYKSAKQGFALTASAALNVTENT